MLLVSYVGCPLAIQVFCFTRADPAVQITNVPLKEANVFVLSFRYAAPKCKCNVIIVLFVYM